MTSLSDLANTLDVAIIGAGFSGTLVATHILNQSQKPVRVGLFERDPRHFARGVAYSSLMDCHLLNVPVGNMSAFPDDPGHFLRWAKVRQDYLIDPPWVEHLDARSFLPRRAYGDYLNSILDEAEERSAPRHTLKRCIGKVKALKIQADTVHLELADESVFRAKLVVLALGNFPPGNPHPTHSEWYQSPRYHRNPWLPGVLRHLLETDSCLLVGSGLTMVDWVVTLHHAGYRGQIHVISRRGLWPLAHRPASPSHFVLKWDQPDVRAGFRQIRQHLADSGEDWRSVMDALRPHTQTLWSQLPLTEKKRFLRHLRPYWDLHRHRLPPQVASSLESITASGVVTKHVGKIQEYRELENGVEVCYRPQRSTRTETLTVDCVVNCSGSDSNYRRLESALVKGLLQQGLIQPDPLALGINRADNGAVIQADGQISSHLYTLGPPIKGQLWETTAVPELRVQAKVLAEHLLKRIKALS